MTVYEQEMFTKFEKLKKIHSLNVTIMYNYEQGEF